MKSFKFPLLGLALILFAVPNLTFAQYARVYGYDDSKPDG